MTCGKKKKKHSLLLLLGWGIWTCSLILGTVMMEGVLFKEQKDLVWKVESTEMFFLISYENVVEKRKKKREYEVQRAISQDILIQCLVGILCPDAYSKKR